MDISTTYSASLALQGTQTSSQSKEVAPTDGFSGAIRQQTPINKEKNADNLVNTDSSLITDQSLRTLLYTQENSYTKITEDTDTTTKSGAVEEFLEFMSKTPEERWREQILKSMGLTEEELAALPPEEREKIEEKITAIIEDKVEKDIANKQREGLIKSIISSLPNQSEVRDILKKSEDPKQAALDITQLQKKLS